MMASNKIPVSYQYISHKTFDIASDNPSPINHLNSMNKINNRMRPLTSKTKSVGVNGSNYFNKPHEPYNIYYVPKRKIRSIFISNPGIESLMPIKSQEPIELEIKDDLNNQGKVNETSNSNNDFLKIRTGYILKFASNSELFNKTKKYSDYLSEDKQSKAMDLYARFRKLYDFNSRIYFDRLAIGNTVDFETWRDLVQNAYEYNSAVVKFVDMLYDDLKNDKDHIMRLKKRNFELETQIGSKTNEIALINDFIKKNALNLKLNQKKQKNVTSQDLRKSFIQKENAYVLTIYRLEDEIKGLAALLEQNKISSTKLQNSKMKAENTKNTMGEMRVVYNQEINGLNMRNSILKEEVEVLREQIGQFEKDNRTWIDDMDNLNDTMFEINKRNKTFKAVIDQRLEIINMSNEESAMYKYLYDKEQEGHKLAVAKLESYKAQEQLHILSSSNNNNES